MPFLKTEVKKSFKAWSDKIARIIDEGKSKNEILDYVNPSDYSYLFIMLIEGGILISKTTDDRNHLFNALDRITKIIDTELIK